MGQRISITEDLGGVILSKKDTDISTENEQSNTLKDVEKSKSNTLKDVEKNSADAAASAAELARQLESGDPPRPAQKDDVEAGHSRGLSQADPAALAALNPSVAELSHLTALRMMRNFEGLSRVDDLFLTHVNEMHERMLEDNLSEKDFRTISYESLPISEFHDTTAETTETTVVLKRDNSTFTHDLMEAEVNDYRECTVSSCPALTVADNISCKSPLTPGEPSPAHEIKAGDKNPRKIHLPRKPAEGEGADDPPPESKQQRGDGPEEEGGSDAAKSPDAEMQRLREALERLECERDVARMRLLIAEEKCRSYEEESRCLEATLDSMETKLRFMASELREEVTNSRQLQHKLTEALRSAGDSVVEPPLEAAA